MLVRIFLLITLLSFFSCQRKSKSVPKEANIDKIIIDNTFSIPGAEPHYKILYARIDNDILIIEVEYKSACKDKFGLYTRGYYQKSSPPSILVYLTKDSQCREETFSRTSILKFDISPLRKTDTEKIKIKIESYKPELLYDYHEEEIEDEKTK